MSEKRKDNNSLAAIFGQRLTELRKNSQLTQSELSEKIGLSRAMISYYESWAKNPTLDVVQKVADFFAVSPDSLIAFPKDDEKKTGPESKLDQQVRRIKKLTPYKQRVVLNVIEATLNAD